MTGALEREGAALRAAWIPAYAGRARGEAGGDRREQEEYDMIDLEQMKSLAELVRRKNEADQRAALALFKEAAVD